MIITQHIRRFVKSIVSYETLGNLHIPEVLLVLVFLLIPFNIRLIWPAPTEFMPGVNRDFISIFLYAIDIPLLLLSVYALFTIKPIPKAVWLISAWLAIELFLNPSKNIGLSLVTSVRMLATIVLAFYVGKYINWPRISGKLAWASLIAGTIQSILALIQFSINRSIGLKWLGESVLSPNLPGVAKLIVSGETIIRGYGTMPHPNILGAFLITSTLLGIYLLNKTTQNRQSISIYFMVILNVLGCFLTFSRATLVGLLIAVSLFWFLQRRIAKVRWQIIILGVSTALITLALWSHLVIRGDMSGQSVVARAEYNRTAINMLLNEGFLGAGPGQSLLHMKQYSDWIHEPWQVQPIHNYPLLVFAELGIGGFILIFLIVKAFKDGLPRGSGDDNKNDHNSTWEFAVWSLIIAFVFVSIFDHYFYTYWPTQVLFWVIIGANFASKKLDQA